jgi:hypothetical protein
MLNVRVRGFCNCASASSLPPCRRTDSLTSTSEYNQKSQLLYVSIHQVFSLFFVPFYKSDVHLTTVLSLTPTENESGDKKYYIRSQEDLYQTNEVVKFFWPGGDWVVWLWQIVATGFCIVGSLAFWPLTMMEDRYHNKIQAVKSTKNGVKGI